VVVAVVVSLASSGTTERCDLLEPQPPQLKDVDEGNEGHDILIIVDRKLKVQQRIYTE
jgi:hypothetical protein